MAGYSGTPLATKLGIEANSTLALVNAPDDLTLDAPLGVAMARDGAEHADVVVAFFFEQRELEARMDDLGSMIFSAGSVWLAWPKKASRVETDLSDNAVRESALRRGLVDNQVCAVDETWSALRAVWRKELRTPRPDTADGRR